MGWSRSHIGGTSGHRPLDDGFSVTIWNPTAKIHVGTTGPKPRFEKWIGNVDVFYGGLSSTFAARVAAAADDLGQ